MKRKDVVGVTVLLTMVWLMWKVMERINHLEIGMLNQLRGIQHGRVIYLDGRYCPECGEFYPHGWEGGQYCPECVEEGAGDESDSIWS